MRKKKKEEEEDEKKKKKKKKKNGEFRGEKRECKRYVSGGVGKPLVRK